MGKDREENPRLSKTVLEMKFMKRTKEKVEKQIYQEEGEEYFGSKVTHNLKKNSGKIIIEPSFLICEGLIDGRVSYQGMNPEIERIMEEEERAKLAKLVKKEDRQEDADISNEEMTNYRIGISKNLKYHRLGPNENEPKGKRPKFLKPAD